MKTLTEKDFIAIVMSNQETDPWLLIGGNYDLLEPNPDKYRPYFLKDPAWSFRFAKMIDEKPRGDTREVCCRDPYWAQRYAHDVDKGPRDDTRLAASKHPEWSYQYAYHVEGYHEITLKAVLNTSFFLDYIKYVEGAEKAITNLVLRLL